MSLSEENDFILALSEGPTNYEVQKKGVIQNLLKNIGFHLNLQMLAITNITKIARLAQTDYKSY